ncbi:MAG: alpha/beta hydrolase [Lachnospiraceae bacterium]|nr:alpha/beta hydrolase [Lachnospiraceae bacterium]
MIKFDEATGRIEVTNGVLENDGFEVRDTFVLLGRGQRGMLYEPADGSKRIPVGVVLIHASADYSCLPMCAELAKRGFTALGGQVRGDEIGLEEKMLNVKTAVNFLRHMQGIEKVVLMGHSGGATLMSAYQSIAENGVEIYQTEEMLYPCPLTEKLLPADGIMLIDSNYGNGAMTLISMDPAVLENGNGTDLDESLSVFNPENGFNGSETAYSAEFLERFYRAQAKRNNEIVSLALERLKALENGEGHYETDEPFLVTGGAQMKPCNKVILADLRLLSHTKESYPLLHADGTVTHEVIYSLRPAETGMNPTRGGLGLLNSTVKAFLSEHAVYASEDYRITETGVEGVCWEQTYNCTPYNVTHISAPLLVMGMTGSYEFMAAEAIYQNASSERKTIAFVEGATHNFGPQTRTEKFPGQYGNTHKILYDYMAEWLRNEML